MEKIDVGENVMQVLSALADKIGTTTEQVWPWMVKQAQIEGITFFCLWVIMFILFIYGGSKFITFLKSRDDEFGEPLELEFEEKGVVYTAVVCISLIFALICVVEGPTAISKILNPEYAALKSLMGMIK